MPIDDHFKVNNGIGTFIQSILKARLETALVEIMHSNVLNALKTELGSAFGAPVLKCSLSASAFLATSRVATGQSVECFDNSAFCDYVTTKYVHL